MAKDISKSGCAAEFFYVIGIANVLFGFVGCMPSAAGISWFILNWLIGGFFLGIGALIDKGQATSTSSRLNRTAGEVLREAIQCASQGEEGSHTLYLRPFYMNEKLFLPRISQIWHTPEPVEMEKLIASDLYRGKKTILEKLFGSFERTQRILVGLGTPEEHVGAGKVFQTEEEWFDGFQALARYCQWVLVIPSYRDGTVRELNWLFTQQLFTKCVFLMPAESFSFDLPEERLNVASEWQKTRDFWQPSLQLPEHHEKGLMFTLNKDKTLRHSEPIHPRSPIDNNWQHEIHDYSFQYRLHQLFSDRDWP